MGAPDTQGIYQYDDTEDFAPLKDFMNLGMESVSATAADIRADIASLELLVDSDWVTITTLGSGWTATPNHPPRVRKVGDRVDLFGSVNLGDGGSVSNLLTLPAGYIPAGAYVNAFVGSGITSDLHAYMLYISSSEPGILRFHPGGYFTPNTSVATGSAVPLLGSWYVS